MDGLLSLSVLAFQDRELLSRPRPLAQLNRSETDGVTRQATRSAPLMSLPDNGHNQPTPEADQRDLSPSS
jgi:hypothetical protein